jgi:hypothetical protein
MATDPDNTDMRHSPADGRYAGFERDDPEESGEPPPRFGRLALCIAAAGALTFGVMGTVAYGVWFNEDQQTYADAIAGARQALGSPASGGVPTVAVAHAPDEPGALSSTQSAAPLAAAQPTTPPPAPDLALGSTTTKGGFEDTNPAVWTGQIHPSAPDPSLTATLADTSTDTATNSATDDAADTSAASVVPTPAPRATKHSANAAESSAHSAKEARLAQERRAAAKRDKGGLFARIGQFFRRVSYRQHDNGRQQQDTYSHP